MSEPSDSTLSISSDSDSAGANDESPSPLEREIPKIPNMAQIQQANSFGSEEAAGGVRGREDYEEYFMSINQHKKSLR